MTPKELRKYTLEQRVAQVVVTISTLIMGVLALIITGIVSGSAALARFPALTLAIIPVITLVGLYINLRFMTSRVLDGENIAEGVKRNAPNQNIRVAKVAIRVLHIFEVLALMLTAFVALLTSVVSGLTFRLSTAIGLLPALGVLIAVVLIFALLWRPMRDFFGTSRSFFRRDEVIRRASNGPTHSMGL